MDWQTSLTVLLAAACAVFLLRGWLRPFFSRGAGGCGGRPGCASQEGSGESGLVQIDGAPADGGRRSEQIQPPSPREPG